MGKTYEKYMTSQRRVKALEEELAVLKPNYPSGFPIFNIRYLDMRHELEDMGLVCQMKNQYVPDTWVPYTTKADIEQIIPFLTYPADYYVYQGADCEDYCKWAHVDATRIFKLGYSVIQVWGDTPLGSHGFNLVKTQEGYFSFEPNAGFDFAGTLFLIGENEYYPQSWR